MSATSCTLMPKMNRFSSPASSAISTLAPSMVPMVRAPFSMNFMFPVPDASRHAVVLQEDDLQLAPHHRVVVHDLRHRRDEADDHLRHVVPGGRLQGGGRHSLLL
ncbi:hypothetical protein F7725_008409 [Dissostichus mawsoni]|uniref:Uncharacterized protein n=1 Tax=Dissostichus mawsoni TaxID=36200 RepID=A0A7J5Y739_DISMA|nr:hypothetical protein F7725_008409 [Dissostichus mawsoni]